MKLTYTIQPNDNFFNVKELLKLKFQISDRLLVKLKKNKKIWLNSTPTFVDSRLKPFDIVEILIDFEEKSENIIPTQIDLNIIYEDEYYIVINKPSGIAIHPSILHYTDSLANGVKFYFEQKNIKKKIRPINRLDKDTSGLIIVAKNDKAHINMSEQIKERNVKKTYIALVRGNVPEEEATINMPIGRSTKDRKKMAVTKNGKQAITHFKVLKRYSKYTLLEIKIETGRTHQIRVHMAEIGYPVVGDAVYSNGKNEFGIEGQMLHAYKLEFMHPITNKHMELTAPLPQYFEEILKKL